MVTLYLFRWKVKMNVTPFWAVALREAMGVRPEVQIFWNVPEENFSRKKDSLFNIIGDNIMF